MIMVLPFITLTITIWLGIIGERAACVWGWLISLVVFGVWSNYHMTDALPVSL